MHLKSIPSIVHQKSLTRLALACAVLTSALGAQAATTTACGTTEQVPPTSEFQKMFDFWTTGAINIADEVASAIPGYKSTKELVDNLKNGSAGVKTISQTNDLRNKLSEQEIRYRAIAQSVVDADKEKTFNSAAAGYFEKYRGIYRGFDEWSAPIATLQSRINEVVALEKAAVALGPETYISHLLLATEKIRLLRVKHYRSMHGLDSHDAFSTLLVEIEYSRNQLNDKFRVYRERANNSIKTNVTWWVPDSDKPRRIEYIAGLRYNGMGRNEDLVQVYTSQDAANKAANQLKECRVNELVNVARVHSKAATFDFNYYQQIIMLQAQQKASTVGQAQLFSHVVSDWPEGVDSVVLDVSRAAGKQCQIALRNGASTIATSSCSTATPSNLFAQSLRPNQSLSAPAHKVTSLTIGSVGDSLQIRDRFVYGANFARGASVREVVNGQVSKNSSPYSKHATDGVKYASSATTNTAGLVYHSPNAGTQLDLNGIRHVGYIRINSLHGARDGTRDLVIKYIGHDGSVFSTQYVSYKIPYGKYHNIVVTSPNAARNIAGQPNVLNVQITSPDPEFRYAEIEAYRPIDSPL